MAQPEVSVTVLEVDLWLYPDDGHISVLNRGDAALRWLRELEDAR